MRVILKNIFCVFAFFLLLGVFPIQALADEPIVIVLDPGHGGENLGAEYKQYIEKNMTLVVANAMAEELRKYDGVEVYLTRTDDEDMELSERAEFASKFNADFLFCLHFNMSPKSNLFGAEVWISAFGEQYARGYSFADIQIKEMQTLGIYSRGIKTKLGNKGLDYYDIIRHCTEFGIPSALIEHCHLDHKNDQSFYDSTEKLIQFGISDATAVAKYFGLKSQEYGIDYSDYTNIQVDIPAGAVAPDMTEPDVCILELVSCDTLTGLATMKITAQDYDSPMLYYNYSVDGGETFTDLIAWPGGTDFEFDIQLEDNTIPTVIARVYNMFDRLTESEAIPLPIISFPKEKTEEDLIPEGEEVMKDGFISMADASNVTESDESNEPGTLTKLGYLLLFSLIIVFFLFVIVMVVKIHSLSRKKRRTRRNRHH